MIEERWTKIENKRYCKTSGDTRIAEQGCACLQMHVPLWYFVSPSYKGRDYKEHMQKGIYDTIPGKG